MDKTTNTASESLALMRYFISTRFLVDYPLEKTGWCSPNPVVTAYQEVFFSV